MENITIKEKYNKIIASGLLLPKDKVSRNGVLYDWDTAKATVSKIPGLPMMYNHQNEGMEKPVGHFTDAIALESRPNSGKWAEVWDKTAEELNISEGIPGVYYEADINPDSEYANSVTRGDVRKVSIQIIPEKQVSETMSDGTKYTRAYIKDYVESSIVPSPGFMETNIAVMCESFNIQKITESCDDTKKEEQTTSNNDVTTTLLKDEDKINEELDEDDYEDLIENLELIELCEKLIYNNKR